MNDVSYSCEKKVSSFSISHRDGWKNVVGAILFLLSFFLVFEHANIHVFKKLSKQVIPQGLILPPWFRHRISFYLSDLVVGMLSAVTIYAYRLSIKKLFGNRYFIFLGSVFFIFFLSIIFSPFSSYLTIYTRLLPFLTSFLLFFIVRRCGDRWLKWVLYSISMAGVVEATIAIMQYFYQGPIGVNCLGELRSFELTGVLPSSDGTRWIIDKWFGISNGKTYLQRAVGTFCDCNPLGGFLSLSILASLALMEDSKKKRVFFLLIPFLIFALFVTFSRSAIFALLITLTVFLLRSARKKRIFFLVTISFLFSIFLLQDQIYQRGGIVNYNQFVKNSDTIRLNQRELAIQMIGEYPLLGVGFKQFTTHPTFNDYGSENGIVLVHDSLLLLAAETGIISTIVLLIFLLLLFKKGWELRSNPCEAVLLPMALIFCLIGFTDFYPLEFQFPKMFLFLILGLIAALEKKKKENLIITA